jgi:hypothetical protein
MKHNEYRIVKDSVNGFEVQIKGWFRWKAPLPNSHSSCGIADAWAHAHAKSGKVVLSLGKLP